MCVNETTPKSQKEVVAEKRGFCSMTMTRKVPIQQFGSWIGVIQLGHFT